MTEGPWKLPPGWRWAELREIAEVHYGKQRPTSTGPVPVLGSGGIYASAAEPLARFPTVVIGRKGAAGQVWLSRAPCWPSDTTFYLEWREPLEATLVFYYLRWARGSLANATSTLPSLQREALEAFTIPLPPLPEQRRIVARIEALFERIREAKCLRTEAQKDADSLLQSAVQEVFPRPGAALPPGWRWVQLQAVCDPANGFGFPKRFQGRNDCPFPFVKVSDMNSPGNEVWIHHAANTIGDDIVQQLKVKIHPRGTIIFPKIGAAIATNKKRILARPATFDNNVMGLIPHSSVIEEFLHHWIGTVDLAELANTTALPSIRRSVISALPIPLPPLPEQRRIAAHLDSLAERVRELKRAQEESQAELKRLEQSILDRAFRGEL